MSSKLLLLLPVVTFITLDGVFAIFIMLVSRVIGNSATVVVVVVLVVGG